MNNSILHEQELLTIIAELQTSNAKLQKHIVELETELAKLRKNSSTSSKPPSSDIVKPPKTYPESNPEKKCKQGAQLGHPKHDRLAFAPEDIDETHEYTLDTCPDCGSFLCSANKAPRVIQQVEVIEKPIRIDEHRGLAYWCENCQKVHYGKLPPAVEKGGLFGSRLTAQVAYMKSVCHASFSTIRKYLRDVVKIKVSRGYLRKVIDKVSKALQQPYDELLMQLSKELWLNVDETGHKDNGIKFWTWCFRAETYTLFKIVDSRSSQILFDVLGKQFSGILGCDYFSAYRKYMKDSDVRVQFCLAHLIRDLKYLTTLSDQATVTYGKDLLNAMREMFGIIHKHETMNEKEFVSSLTKVHQDILIKGMCNIPQTKEAQNMANRFRLHGDAYFRFITTPGVEPTNNLAEQAIRFVVIDRVITQGTRSEEGRNWCERIWTTLATCSNQTRSAYEFICNAVQAYFVPDQLIPSLLMAPP
ncbi:MAG: IS66 family transposase [Candidatus Omnitrophica bacterium]|nr:IS66 family transposase [Candidatus Omnitrophota bacterium]